MKRQQYSTMMRIALHLCGLPEWTRVADNNEFKWKHADSIFRQGKMSAHKTRMTTIATPRYISPPLRDFRKPYLNRENDNGLCA
jgi:hypothetical protein